MNRTLLMISMALVCACTGSEEDYQDNETKLSVVSSALTNDETIMLNNFLERYSDPYAPIRYGSSSEDYGKATYRVGFSSGHGTVTITNTAASGSRGRDVIATISGDVECKTSAGAMIVNNIPKFKSPGVRPGGSVTVSLAQYCPSGHTAFREEIELAQTSYGR